MYEPITAKQNTAKKNALWIAPLSMFVMISVLPIHAVQPVAHVEVATRDPYLTEAIEGLPDYAYTNAGSLAGGSAPVTEKGNWPVATAHFIKNVAKAADIRPQPAYAAEVTPDKVSKASLLVMQGEASYYSRAGCLGCDPNVIMANGQPLNDNALTMAIGADKVHLVGHTAKVTSLATGKAVMVRITDTGGFYKPKYGSRVADLTIATKQAIGMKGGVGQVKVEVF